MSKIETDFANLITSNPIRMTSISEILRDQNTEITFAQVGTNRILSHQIPTRKGKTVTIHDKQWYFRLVISRHTQNNKTRALLQDYSIPDLARHLVVCYTPNTLPGSPKLFRRQDGAPIRLYAYFDSYLEFCNYMALFSPEDRNFYEIIFGELPQKPHFDIDIDLHQFGQSYPGEDIGHVSEQLLDAVIMGCATVIDQHEPESHHLQIDRDVLVYSSHGAEKRSYHIVITNKCHMSNQDSKAFYGAVVQVATELLNHKYIEFIDSSVYSPRQQFRIFGNRKLGSDRPKIFHENFKVNGYTHTHTYIEPTQNTERKKLVILYESLVSFVSGCYFLQSLVPPEPERTYSTESLFEVTMETAEYCLRLLRQNMNPCPFSIHELEGGLILLKRHHPSRCPLCDKIHEHENPYMWIANGTVYWDCRRCMQRDARLKVGYLGITIGEMETGKTIPGIQHSVVEASEAVEQESEENFMFGDFHLGKPGVKPKVKPGVKDVEDEHLETLPDESVKPAEISTPNPQNNHVAKTLTQLQLKTARQKYIRQTPEDIGGRYNLTHAASEMAWAPGIR